MSRDAGLRGVFFPLRGQFPVGRPAVCQAKQGALIDDALAVEMQVLYGRPSRWRLPDDLGVIFVPGKMFAPSVPSGMKERYKNAGHGINRCGMRELVTVASLTGKREITMLIRASQNTGVDMLNRKIIRGIIGG